MLFLKFFLKSITKSKSIFNKLANYLLLIRYRYNSGGKLIVGHPSSHSEDPVLREAAFKVYNGPNAESEELLDNLLESRHKLALTCGFPSYAHR